MGVTEQYEEGRKSGETWNSSWVPGGPWVMTPCVECNGMPGFLERCKQSKEEHEAWMRGWWDGLRAAHRESVLKTA